MIGLWAWSLSRDSAGEVRAGGNFTVLQPVDPAKRRGLGLVEVSDRGDKFSRPYFNYATAGLAPSPPEAFGGELLMEKGLAVGVSQTGRFLRHFLYQGFNTDEQGRQAYDGVLAIAAATGAAASITGLPSQCGTCTDSWRSSI